VRKGRMEIDDHTKQMGNDGKPVISKEGRRERSGRGSEDSMTAEECERTAAPKTAIDVFKGYAKIGKQIRFHR